MSADPLTSVVPPPPTADPVPDHVVLHGARRSRYRTVAQLVAAGVWIGAFVGLSLTRGVPIDREQVLVWVVGGLVIAAMGSSGRAAFRALRDWLPFALVLIVYDLSRGAADGLGRPVWYRPQITIDRWIGGGEVPTVRLQRALLAPRHIAWWEVLVSFVYLSHFVVPFLVAAVLWLRDRRQWMRFVVRFTVLSFAACILFVLTPSAPPWLAGRAGLLPPVHRTAARGWSLLGLDVASRLVEKGQASVNMVAAIPSLHAGYALLVALVLWSSSRWWTRVALATYVVAMGFTLVLSGEHYVIDVLIGWTLTVAVHLGLNQVEAWRRRTAPPDRADDRAARRWWRRRPPPPVGSSSPAPGR